MYEAPGPEISFGDIFSADWFFDAYVRADAVPLVEFTAKGAGKAWKPAKPSNHRDYLFAHGQQRQAILLSDDCEIDTILARGGRRRLIFAAIERLPVSKSQAEEALATRAFRRFPLPPEGDFHGGIAEFQQLFGVATDAIQPTSGEFPRFVRLDPEMRLKFEMRWNAYAARRGPLSHIDNAEKFARLLAAAGSKETLEKLKTGEVAPGTTELELAKEVAGVLGMAWEIEGAVMNGIAEAYEREDTSSAARDRLLSGLKDLAARAQRAVARLEAPK
jgi:hypothetical protein